MISDAKQFSRNDIIRLARVNELAWTYNANITEHEFNRIQDLVHRRFLMKEAAILSLDEKDFLADIHAVLEQMIRIAA